MTLITSTFSIPWKLYSLSFFLGYEHFCFHFVHSLSLSLFKWVYINTSYLIRIYLVPKLSEMRRGREKVMLMFDGSSSSLGSHSRHNRHYYLTSIVCIWRRVSLWHGMALHCSFNEFSGKAYKRERKKERRRINIKELTWSVLMQRIACY